MGEGLLGVLSQGHHERGGVVAAVRHRLHVYVCYLVSMTGVEAQAYESLARQWLSTQAVFPCYVCVRVLQATACILGGQGAAGTGVLVAVIFGIQRQVCGSQCRSSKY